MNQDGLENFFGCVRSCCHNSSSLIATHFRAAFTTVFVNNLSSTHSIKSNCEPDWSTPLLTDIHYLLLKKNNDESNTTNIDLTDTEDIHDIILKNTNVESNTPNIVKDNSITPDSNIVDEFENETYDSIIFQPEFSEQELNFINEEAISNLSTLVCNKLLKATMCDECRSTLETSSNLIHEENDIKYPSNLFVQNFKKIFCNIDESLQYICAEKCLKKKVVESLENVKLEEMGCPEHFVEMKLKFKEFSTIFGIISFCKRVNNLLSGKNKVYSDNFNLMEQLAFTCYKKKKGIGKYSDIYNELEQ